MKRFLLLALLAFTPLAKADYPIFLRVDSAGSYSAWIRNPAGTVSVKVDLTAGSGDYAKQYTATNAALISAGLTTAGTYNVICYDVAAASVTDSYVPFSNPAFLVWSGSAEVLPSTTADISSLATVVTTLIPVSQIAVAEIRTWTLTHTTSGLVGDAKRYIHIGDGPKPFAVDFRNDLATNGRLATLDSVVIRTGTALGVTIDTDLAIDKTQAKVKLTGVTAGTYVLRWHATYDSSSGGGSAVGDVTLVVVE